MYNPNYEFFAPTGWRCPGCGRIYSPNTSMCPYCGGNSKITYQKTTATPNWIYKEDPKTSSSVKDWWTTYLELTTADSGDAINNLFQTTTYNSLRSEFFDNNSLWEKPL